MHRLVRVTLSLIFTVGFPYCARAACTFPTDLVGSWETQNYGTLTFTSDSFSGFVYPNEIGTKTFTCEVAEGTQYVAKTTLNFFTSLSINKFLCMNLTPLSSVKYKMTLDSSKDSDTGIRVYTSSADTVTVAEACSVTDSRSEGEYELLLLASSILSAIEACPSDFLFLYEVTSLSTGSTSCQNSTLDGTTSGALIFNYTTCASAVVFNSGAYLSCLYHFTSGDVSFLTTYNNDTSTDETTKFKYTCMAFSKTGGNLSATEYPKSCQTSQTPTVVDTAGIAYYLWQTDYIAPTEEAAASSDNTAVIVAVVCVLLVILIVVVFAVCYFKVWKNYSPPTVHKPLPEKPKKKKRPKLFIINEHTLEKPPKALSTIEEKSTDTVTSLTRDRSSLRIDHHKEPTKEKWQKQWETDLRPPPTPTSARALLNSSQYPSAGGLSTLTNFSSFENIPKTLMDDRAVIERISTKLSLQQDSAEENQEEPVLNETLVTPKSTTPRKKLDQLTPRIKEREKTLDAGRISPMTLSTQTQTEIKHDDFSPRPEELVRGNELPWKGTTPRILPTLPENQNVNDLTIFPSDSRSVITDTGTFATSSRSVLTAGKIQLHETLEDSTTLGNYSLSSSMVFDDPSWLQKTDQDTDKVWTRGADLWSTMPLKKSKNPRWFMEGQVKVDEPKLDRNYFSNRTKLAVGLNSQTQGDKKKAGTKVSRRNWRSRSQPKLDAWRYVWEHQEPRPAPTVFIRRFHSTRSLPSRTGSFSRPGSGRRFQHSPGPDTDDTLSSNDQLNVAADRTVRQTSTSPDISVSNQGSQRLSVNRRSLKRKRTKRLKKNKRCQTDRCLFLFDDPVETHPPDELVSSSIDITSVGGKSVQKQPQDEKQSTDQTPETSIDAPKDLANIFSQTHPPKPGSPVQAETDQQPEPLSTVEKDSRPNTEEAAERPGTSLSLASTVLPPDLTLVRADTEPLMRIGQDTVLSRARTDFILDSVHVDYMYDTISLYSEVFYPEDWIHQDDVTPQGCFDQAAAMWSARYKKAVSPWHTDFLPSINC